MSSPWTLEEIRQNCLQIARGIAVDNYIARHGSREEREQIEAAVDRYCRDHAQLDPAAYKWTVDWDDRTLPAYDVTVRERSAVDRLADIARSTGTRVGSTG